MWKPRGRKNFGSKCAKLCWMWAKNKEKTAISVLTIAPAHELRLTWEFVHVLRNVQIYKETYFVFGIPTVKMRKNARASIWWHYLKKNKMRKCAHEGILLCLNEFKNRLLVVLSISELLKKKLGQSEFVSPSYVENGLTIWRKRYSEIIKI